jgi:hypothetical protein
VDVPDIEVASENILERLEHFKTFLADTSQPAADRAIGLAWVLHLVGDVHQPLHCSARVTIREPAGDKGANDFKLDSKNKNLHAYWDSMIGKAIPRRSNEGTSACFSSVDSDRRWRKSASCSSLPTCRRRI